MIAELIQLSALYVLVRVFIEIAMPNGKVIVKYLFWAGIALTIVGTIGPQFTRLLDDIHNASVAYTQVKQGVQTVTSGVDAVTSWPETKESIPILGTGPSKYPPGLSIKENLLPTQKCFDWPVQGAITQPFRTDLHHGIDIACNVGTPVKAARDGKVCAVNSDNVYGNYVMIDHGGQWQTLYAHLSKVMVTNGQHVWGDRDVIGLSGGMPGSEGAGNSTGPHLHFEIRVGDIARNPADYLK